mgnify:CR=1 FL=1
MDKTVPSGRVKGTLTPPCSKSYAQRALAASLLCEETSVLRNIEFCSDTRSALQCIETLGARVTRIGEETLSIEGGLRPQGHTLRVGESGLSTRLFTPIASLCGTPITIEGEGTLLRRPMEMMTGPLRTLGVRVRDNGGFLPFEVRGSTWTARLRRSSSRDSCWRCRWPDTTPRSMCGARFRPLIWT